MPIRVGTLCFVRRCTVRPQCNGRVVEVVEPLQPMPWPDGIHMSYGVYAPWIKEVFDLDTPKAAKPGQLVPFSDPDNTDGCRYCEPLAPMVPVRA